MESGAESWMADLVLAVSIGEQSMSEGVDKRADLVVDVCMADDTHWLEKPGSNFMRSTGMRSLDRRRAVVSCTTIGRIPFLHINCKNGTRIFLVRSVEMIS